MNEMIAWIAAAAEPPEAGSPETGSPETRTGAELHQRGRGPTEEQLRGVGAHQFPRTRLDHSSGDVASPAAGAGENPHVSQNPRDMGHPELPQPQVDSAGDVPTYLGAEEYQAWLLDEYRRREYREDDRERRTYRSRTVKMLRRYMRYSLETGRVPSILGREFFRTQVTSYTVVTFEDRVIFVHDMERCLQRLDEFSRQLIARHVLQEHDRWETARLLHCNEKTVRRLIPLALDLLSEMLLDGGLLERLDSPVENSCQGGLEGEKSVSDWEEDK